MTLPPRRKHIRHDQGEGHLHELTFSCFRFWQEGPGFDRNLFGPEAITASMDYIHLNPVKRGLCEKATDWKWSSARFYLGETTLPGRDNGPGFTNPHSAGCRMVRHIRNPEGTWLTALAKPVAHSNSPCQCHPPACRSTVPVGRSSRRSSRCFRLAASSNIFPWISMLRFENGSTSDSTTAAAGITLCFPTGRPVAPV